MRKGQLKGQLKRHFLKEEIFKIAPSIRPSSRKKVRGPKFLLPRTKVKIIGIGGGGNSIVSEIAEKVGKADFIVADTDQQSLERANKNTIHFQFGQELTQGLGTGMEPELGLKAAEGAKEKIKELLQDTDFCILISSLGGGVGSGAPPVFAEISRELKNITLGIFILPFEFEGKKKMDIARLSLEKLKPNLNISIIIPNEKIFQIAAQKTPFKEALSIVNEFLANNLKGLLELIYSPGLINIDFACLKTALEDKGNLAYLNTAEVQTSDQQVEELVRKVLSCPLYPYSPKEVSKILFNIDGGSNLSLDGLEKIGKCISEAIGPKAEISFKVTQNIKDKIKITLLAIGCKWDEQVFISSRNKEWEKETAKKQILIQEKPKKKAKKKLAESPKIPQIETTQIPTGVPEKVKIKVRRDGLEVQKAIEEEEKKILAQERKWEIPAFLRRKPS
ncbi:cell division FtsZ family protein [Patescibacteria group bacterium]|nr:cell division FtsZ family protein [Patescibacteria group bacterium]